MDDPYSARLAGLLADTRPALAADSRLTLRRLFGAVGGYIDGCIFASCGAFGVALKLPQDTLEDLFRDDGVERLRYFPRGHVKREYAVLPARILNDRRQFGRLVDESVAYALS